MLETYLSPLRNIHPFHMQVAVDRVAPRIRAGRYAVCQVLQQPRYQCNLVLNAQIHVHQDNPLINAAADQYNEIHVNGGLIHYSGSDDEVVAVLAHEFAHVMLVHVDKTLLNALIGHGIALALLPDGALPQSTQRWADYGAAAYSPDMEQEADRVAIYILRRAGYRPEEMQDFLVRATREGARQVGLVLYSAGFLQAHPSENYRVAHLVSAIQDARSGEPLIAT